MQLTNKILDLSCPQVEHGEHPPGESICREFLSFVGLVNDRGWVIEPMAVLMCKHSSSRFYIHINCVEDVKVDGDGRRWFAQSHGCLDGYG